jgi:hypothetical protein
MEMSESRSGGEVIYQSEALGNIGMSVRAEVESIAKLEIEDA